MLPLVLGLAICDGGMYWCEDAGTCITAANCSWRGLIAYKLRMQCDSKFAPVEASGLREDEHGVSACPDGSYTVLNESFIWCVRTAEECDGYYVEKQSKFCVHTERLCRNSGRMVYNRTGQNECISDCF